MYISVGSLKYRIEQIVNNLSKILQRKSIQKKPPEFDIKTPWVLNLSDDKFNVEFVS